MPDATPPATPLPATPPPTTPYADFKAMLRDAWIPVVVVLAIFIAHHVATGIDTGGAAIGAAAGMSVVGGHAVVAKRPQLSPWARRGVLAAISAAASVGALVLFDLLR